MYRVAPIISICLLIFCIALADPSRYDQINVWIPDTSADPGNTITIPIMVGDLTGQDVIACDIILSFDADILTADSAYFGIVVPGGWLLQTNFSTGQVIIAMAGFDPLYGSGDLLWVRYRVNSGATPGDTTSIRFERCDFNEGAVSTEPMDGLFTVAGLIPYHDVGVTTILSPTGTVTAGTVVTPSVIVENFGNQAETFPVTFEFGTYSNTQTVTNLSPGAIDTIDFTTWTAVIGTYNTISYTQLVDDENISNDTTYGSFEVVPVEVHDVGVTVINAPIGTITSGTVVTPSVTVENFGTETETFNVTFMFGTYSNTQTVTDLVSGATTTVNFADWTAVVGSYNTMSYTMLAGDEDMSNDTAYGSFEVIPEEIHDVGVTTILAPTGTIIAGTLVTPSVIVENFGNQTESFDVKFEFSGYTDTKTVTDLGAGATTIVNFTNWTAVVGSYSTMSYTMLVDDEDMSNDTAYGSFEVVSVEEHDVGVTAINAPIGTITVGTVVTPSVMVENFGTETETFNVTFMFSTYSDTQTVTDLASGATITVNFTNWTAVVGNYNTMSYTMLMDDEDMSNDTAYGSFEVVPEEIHDVGVNEILAPLGTITEGTLVTPSAVVENFGTETETFDVIFSFDLAAGKVLISNVTNGGRVFDLTDQLYIDTINVTLSAGEVDTLEFMPWTAIIGTYDAMSYSMLLDDENPSNDTAIARFVVIPAEYHDVGVTEILAPTGIIMTGTVVTPTSVVENFGTETETFWVRIMFNGTYEDSLEVTLDAGEIDTLEFMPWTAVVGNYNTMSYSMLIEDEDMSNDTAYGSFEVIPVAGHDVGVLEILEPLDTIIGGSTVTPTAIVKNFGGYFENFWVFFVIGCEYSCYRVLGLGPGEIDTVMFDPWVAVDGYFNEGAATYLENDENPDNDAVTAWLTVISIEMGVNDNNKLPINYSLLKPYPNPVTNNLMINFALPKPASVEISVYDINGRTIKTLISGTKSAGTYQITNSCRELGNGVYIVRMKADKFEAIEKFVVTK